MSIVLQFEFDNVFKFGFLVALEAPTLKIASQPGNVSFGNFDYLQLLYITILNLPS